MVTHSSETEIAEVLSAVADRYPQVQIGSYPQFETKPWSVTITLDGRDADALSAAEAELQAQIVILPGPS